MSSVTPLKSKEPTTSNLSPEISVPSKFSGSIPFRSRSPVAFSSTHQTSSRDSTSKPPASEIKIFTSCDSGSRTENGRGLETSTGSGPVPSTIIHRTAFTWSVASTPCPSRHPTLHVKGMVWVVEGACKATDQIPSSELAVVEEPENRRSISQSKSGTVPVSEKTTPPAISNGLLGANLAPSSSNAPCERIIDTLSSGTSRAAENRHRCSGNARNTSCPARSIT